ncbi:hypothetical protein PG990_005343 [Apiospora arundinis]|uniref:UPF0145 domain-containing protein n=1 Tax=Apiospora arundinis TaxID=335852 RepID=A0ABR2J761_9PEZI
MSPSKKDATAPTLVNIDVLKPGLRCVAEAPDVMTTTTSDMPGYRVTRVLGAVFANSWQFSNPPFSRSTSYQKLNYFRSNEAMSRLVAETRSRGGNAILRVRYDHGPGTFVHGTAVVVEKM